MTYGEAHRLRYGRTIDPTTLEWQQRNRLVWVVDLRVIVLRPVLFVAVAALLMCGGCSGPDALPTREAAIRRATADAERSWPEFTPVTSRIDGSAAEMVTLEEARRRMGWSGLEGSGRAPGTQVWWVRLWGEFRYTGSVAGQIEVAAEHQTVYDARTGDLLGRRTSPAVP